ncbi:ABC transporter G family member 37 [Hordeum vulgare]|nr:ABC transporter G family member 37 [Hordeum vulgare]
MVRKGFDSHWIARVMQMVMSGRTTININGEVGPYFPTAQGVRQGDPVSPFLFKLVVDALAAILDKAKAVGHISGLCHHLLGAGGITHLQYADDTILMVQGSASDIAHLKFLLLCFQEMFALTINFSKSEVMVLGYTYEEKLSIANRLNCRLRTFPTTYLGMPINDSRILEKDLRLAVDKFQHRVESWQGRWLSKAARMAGKGDKQKYHMVKWSKICKPKDQGSLGVISSKRMNIALLAKWLWRISYRDGSMWLDIIRAKYLRGQPLAFATRSGGSQFSQTIVQLMPF